MKSGGGLDLSCHANSRNVHPVNIINLFHSLIEVFFFLFPDLKFSVPHFIENNLNLD